LTDYSSVSRSTGAGKQFYDEAIWWSLPLLNITAYYPENITIDYGTNQTLNVTVEGTGTFMYRWLVNSIEKLVGVGENIIQYLFGVDTIGNANVTVQVNDSYNQQVSYEWDITVYNENPTPYLYAPSNNTNTNENITLEAYCIDYDNVSLILHFLVDDILNESISGVNSTTVELNYSTPGSHNWSIKCDDGIVNVTSEVWYFAIDYDSPSISILHPTETTYSQYYNDSSIDLNWTYTETNLEWCGYSLDGGEYISTIYPPSNISMVNLTNGTHTVYIRCNDTFGNTGISDTITFGVNNVYYPEIQWLSPNTGYYDNMIPIHCFAEIYDNTSLYYWVDMYYNNGTATQWHPILSNSSTGFAYVGLDNISIQTNVSIRCNVTHDFVYYDSAQTNGTISFVGEPRTYLDYVGSRDFFVTKIPYTMSINCDAKDAQTNASVYGSWADCENDGVRDYYWKEDEYSNMLRSKTVHKFTCISLAGTNEVSAGCIYEKQQTNTSWVDICQGLTKNDDLCTHKVTVEIEVEE